ncbi:hypothetical protein E4K10_00665 [Streptomyces sp. T1317-0309]|nr:hypothetical protein E4K10_00665 [Streptomyces sp. T1317-0309]
MHLTVSNGPATRSPDDDLPSGGHGLVGLRERAALLGGHIDAAPSADGFRSRRRRAPVPAGGRRSLPCTRRWPAPRGEAEQMAEYDQTADGERMPSPPPQQQPHRTGETVAVRGSGAPVSSRPFEGLIQLLPTPSVVAAITRAASTRRGDQNDAEKTPDATPTVDQVLVADGTPRPSADRRGRCGAVPVASEVSAPTPPGTPAAPLVRGSRRRSSPVAD